MRQAQRDLSIVGKPDERAFAEALAILVGPASGYIERQLRKSALQCESAGDLWCAGLCWEMLGVCLGWTNPAEGFRAIHHSLALRRRCGDQWSIALGFYALGLLLEDRGLLHGARRRFEESLTRRRRLGVDPDWMFICLEGITRVALCAGAVDDARRHGGESLIMAQRTGDLARIGLAQTRLAQAHYLAGTSVEARPLLEPALITAEEMENAEWSSHLHALGGLVALEAGEEEEARWSLERALSAMPPTAHPAAGLSALDDFLRSWPTGWRDLLQVRLALDPGGHDASRRALGRALEQALASHHEPLLREALAAWAEWRVRTGRPFPVGRLASMFLVCSALPEQRRIRLESILRGAGTDAQTAPAGAEKDAPAVVRRTPAVGPSGTALFTLAAEVLSDEQVSG
jgi:hypothetical protein